MGGTVQFSLPTMSAAMLGALKEDIGAYKVDIGSGETNMDFEAWLRSTRPQRYQLYDDLRRKMAK